MLIPPASHTILATESTTVSFSGFQQLFHESWDFFFPNVVVLTFMYAITRLVGGVKWNWLDKVWAEVKGSVATFSHLLQSSNLPGARLFPLAALIVAAVLFLDVFGVVRSAAKSFIPPSVHIIRPDIYEHVLDDGLFTRILLSGSHISSRRDMLDLVDDWRHRVENDKGLPGAENVAAWSREAGDWSSLMGDVKLLGLVTLISLLVGVHHKSLKLLRFFGVIAVLVGVYIFFMAKFLYATEQEVMAAASSYERYLAEAESSNWNAIVQRGEENIKRNKEWLTIPMPASVNWWRMQWIDSWFYERAWKAITRQAEPSQPSLSDEDLARIQERLKTTTSAAGGTLNGDKNTTPTKQESKKDK